MNIAKKLVLHPALKYNNPLDIERLGDKGTSAFDRWLCYHRAYQLAVGNEVDALHTDRILKKLSTTEQNSNLPIRIFEAVSRTYISIISFCQKYELTIEQGISFIEELEESRQKLTAFQQPDFFILLLEKFILNQKPSLREQYFHIISTLGEFFTTRIRLRQEGNLMEYYVFAKSRLTIGRSDKLGEESDIFVLDTNEGSKKTYISRFHAILEYTPPGFWLIPHEKMSYDLWIERENQMIKIDEPIYLHHNDRIVLGKQRSKHFVAMRYTKYIEKTESSPSLFIDPDTKYDSTILNYTNAVKITIEEGMPENRVFIICVSKSMIGREADNPIQIWDRRVSHIHALLTYRNGGFWLRDARSSNGTYINGELCSELTPILIGDNIKLGKGVNLTTF